jgi:GNAT superfamily N-acetyltransferase
MAPSDFVALRQGVPMGACTLFFDEKVVGFHDVGVLPATRGQGIGTALMRHACEFARRQGAVGAVLISSAEGYGVYVRAGFADVARIGYWYRRFNAS